jgi:hypothetical protein
MKCGRNSASLSPIAEEIIADFNEFIGAKVIDIRDIKKAKIRAEKLEATISSEKELACLDPLHAVYVYGQNKMSVFVEQLAELPVMSELAEVYTMAEQEYMPSGPPISPLTQSYFTCWGFFDLCVGTMRESFGSIAIEVCKSLDVDQGLIRVFTKMQASRMGFYVHEGFSGQHVMLREFLTGKRIKAIVASGYKGDQGEIWFARIMPEPFEELPLGYSVVFTTPYVIGEVRGKLFYQVSDQIGWLAFFERTLKNTGEKNDTAAYEELMKYGLSRHYWNEYIFEAYVNDIQGAILLTGFPDIPLSRPHSRESSGKYGRRAEKGR